MDKEFRHRGNKLGRLIEECGEVIHACGKAIRFGIDNWNPYDKKQETNREMIKRELADLKDAINQVEKYLK